MTDKDQMTPKKLTGLACAATLLVMPAAVAAKKAVPPPNFPPPLSPAERDAGLPGVQYSTVIEAIGTPVVAQSPSRDGATLLSIPYRYRHTAVVAEDVTGFSITVGGVQVPAGSPGYYAGSFRRSDQYLIGPDDPPMDLWCFFPSVAGGKRKNICLLRDNFKRAAIAPTRLNPYLWDHFAPMTGTFDYVHTPIFRREAVELPVKPVLEYRFAGWKNDVAVLRTYVLDDQAGQLFVPKNANGDYRLRTVAGDFILTPAGTDPAAANIAPAR